MEENRSLVWMMVIWKTKTLGPRPAESNDDSKLELPWNGQSSDSSSSSRPGVQVYALVYFF